MRIVWLILVLLAFGAPAATQGSRAPDADLQATLAHANAEIQAAGSGFRTASLSDEEIKARLAAIGPAEASLSGVLSDLAPRLRDASARQAQLGPPPPKGEREDARTAALRDRIGRAVTIFQDDEKQARLLVLEGRQISDVLSERLRENFTARLTSQNRSLFDPSLWRMLVDGAAGDFSRIAGFVADEADALAGATRSARDLGILAGALILALVLAVPARFLLIRFGVRRAARDERHTRLTRSLLAIWRVAVGTATPLLAGLVLRAGLSQADALTDAADQAVFLLVRVTTFAAFVASLGRAVLAPRRPEWRLAPIPDDMVGRVSAFPALIGAAAALATFVAGIDAVLGIGVAGQVIADNVTVILEIVAVAGGLIALGRGRRALQAASQDQEEARLPWVLAALAGWLALIGAAAATLIGYLAFAAFVMRETIWIGAVLGLVFLMVRAGDELAPTVLSPQRRLGAALETGLGLTHQAIEQIAVLVSGALRVILFALAWAAIVAPFGAGAGDVFGRFTAASLVLRLGHTTVSPGAILGAAALFVAGLVLTRAVRRWLVSRYLPKTRLDVGVRTSLAAGISYLGVGIALLIAFASLGLSFSQIALFASALSVGIGFGLQSIIGNFVSGLILLAERPIRVGDWIALGDLEGDVRKISVRATEIEMQDRSRLIVPNSDLITKTVRNITHASARGRVKIVLKTVDGADPIQVRDLLRKILAGHKEVLKDPAPGVYLTNVADGALEFTCLAYLKSPRDAVRVRSDLYFQIVPGLAAAGVGLSNSTPVVNVGLGERQIDPAPQPPGPES